VAWRRRRRAAIWGSAGLTAAAGLIIAILATTGRPPVPPPEPDTAGRIAALRGSLELVPPAGTPATSATPSVGLAVAVGTRLRTGPETFIALELADGASLRLDRDTSASLDSPRAVLLDAGAAYVDSRSGTGGAIEVRTPLGTASDVGTQFEVRHEEDGLLVRVREGSVSVSRRDESFEVSEGTTMTVLPDGSTSRGTTRRDGPEWQWAAEAAPALEIEGQSAVVFLRWVSRETGLGLTFASDAVERFAAATTLHGTIEGLSPAHAAEVVLPSCGLGHRVVDGTLVVERLTTETREP